MPTSLQASPGRALFFQVNRNDTDGTPLTTTGDVLVMPGCAIEGITWNYETETINRQSDGCQSIAGYEVVRGAEMQITFGSIVPFDWEDMLGIGVSQLSGVAQVGYAETAIGSQILCPPGIGTSAGLTLILWREALICSAAVGIWVDVFTNVAVKSRPPRGQFQRTNPLGTRQFTFTYTSNSAFDRGPGEILPADFDTGYPSYSFVQSENTDVAPATSKYKFPGSTLNDGCLECGTMPAGFLSGVHAVGGASNTGTPGGNASY